MNSARGGYVKIVVGIVLAVVAVLAVMYFTSDVARTKIRVAADQYAHWTPENIAKDPENYLNFCEQEAEKALLGLKASEISVAQNSGKLQAMVQEATGKIGIGERALTQLKEAYAAAEADGKWPVTWEGAARDKDFVKRQIVALARQVEGQRTLKSKIENGLKNLDAQSTRIQEGRAQAQAQLAEIKTSREILKVQKITDDLTERLASIGAVIRTTSAIATESTATVSLDQLAASSVATVDESEFEAIMAKK